MNEGMKRHFIEALKNELRFDERKLDEFRDISIETGIISTAEGSARVKVGNTEVIAGVKMSIMKPYPDSPNKGSIMVNYELSPLSSKGFEPGPPTIQSIELSRVVDRGIRESDCIDFESLCIEVGEKVWLINIDICPINDDGNLMDVGALAALAALKNTKIPNLTELGAADYKTKGKKSIKLKDYPITVTVYKVGDDLIIDPTMKEEEYIDSRLTVTSLKDKTICALQKGGDESLTIEDVDKMTTLALDVASKLRKKI